MLTDTKVRTAKPRPKPYKLTDGNRLFLLVTPTGGKLWRWSYYFDGKQKGMAFGGYPRVSLADARAKRDEAYTAHLLDELQLYGHRPFDDAPDPRPLPEDRLVRGAVADIFDALIVALADTRMESDLDNLLWSQVNLFHRAETRFERLLDDNEQAQKRLQREQDGSKVKSVELERLIAQGISLIERRNTLEAFRELAGAAYEAHCRKPWRPHHGSLVHRRTLTSSLIDSREFLAARARADATMLLPAGPRIAFTGGLDCVDHTAIWAALDRCRAKHPDMVLLHGGAAKGAELVAARWADHRQVTQIAFKPDWTRHAKAAPFKRNDAMLDTLPIGVVVFPGSGIQDNLADKARKLGIPLFDFRCKGGERRPASG